MAINLLPIDAVNISLEGNEAKWISPTENSLKDLVEDLSEYKQQVDVTSIPDIWAGPKAFEAQLLDDIEEQCVKWRAVLAIIGLRKVLRFNLKVKSIEIPKVLDAAKNKNTHIFLKVVSRLMDSEFKNYPGGNSINLICNGNETIAMVWPNSIVYPIPGVGVSAAPWWVGGRYCDPSQNAAPSGKENIEAEKEGEETVQSSYLSEVQRYILAKWLKKLWKSVGTSPISTAEKICNLLEGYIQDLGYKIDDLSDDDNQEELLFTENDKDFAIDGVGSMLGQVYMTPSSKEDLDLSHIRLDGLNNQKHVLVIDESIATQWNKQSSNITCFGATDLGSALDIVNDDAKKRQFLEESKLASYGAELWTADNFFTDKLIYISGFAANANPFPNSLTEKDEYKNRFCFDFGKNNLQEFILPIRKEVLDFIAPEDLVNSITIDRPSASSPVTVSLRIELSGSTGDGTKQAVTLTKVYDTNIVKRTTVPNVQIWPNFAAKCWKQYYVFTGTALEPNMIIEPAWSDIGVENLNFDVKAKQIKVKLRRGAEFPSVFTCQIVEKEKSEPAGLICLDTGNLDTPKDNTERKTSYIGVDFGTTNSVVYYANNLGDDAIREQMRFEDRHFEVTRVKEDSKADLRRYFFPANIQPESVKGVTTNSIRTIFHDFNLEDELQVTNFDQPLVMGNIYYLENGQNISDDTVVIDELKGNIKWDNIQEADTNEKRMKAFIHQLCLQAMAEAVMHGAKKIIWQYSWPSAYDSDKRKNYAAFWQNSLVEAMNDIADLSKASEVYQKTESFSMADYFQKGVEEQDRGNAYSNGLLTIDIGGGSTDIAVFKGKDKNDRLKCLHQCSFRMAGTDIFSNYIKTKYKNIPDLFNPLGSNNRDLKKMLDKLTVLALEAKHNPTSWKTFELELESILKYSEKDLIKEMGVATLPGPQYQALNVVMRDIAFALGGIFYYAGSIIGFLRKTDADCSINRRLPDCFVGGNGSKLLDWASKGAFAKADKMKIFLRDCIVFGMLHTMNIKGSELNGFGVQTSIKQSGKPKHEVSFGLIAGLGNSPTDEELEPDINIGEVSNTLYGDFDDSLSEESGSGNSGFDDDLGDKESSIVGNVEQETNKHKSKVYPVISGELYFENGSEVSSDEKMIAAENFTDQKKRITVDFNLGRNRFVRYCKVFNNRVEKYHLFNGKGIIFSNSTRNGNDLARIFENVANLLESRETRTGRGVVVEPIFIMELREAMKKLSNY